ncbi:uncharacterized protein LOC143897985 isoform X2 [Temnothorax americanus]|uniref:uncharacterized protein LOC143897985 isoform X2 n=1 Tax=Temnothorax americanus TaxID=1964332 RepID=UPI0040683982
MLRSIGSVTLTVFIFTSAGKLCNLCKFVLKNNMPQITLYDSQSQSIYTFDVTEADAERANNASTVCDVDNVTNTTQASVQDDSQEKDSFRWLH